MINTRNKSQMEQIAQTVQGLTFSQCVGLLACGFGMDKTGLEITQRIAKAQNNTIVFGAGIKPEIKGDCIKAIFASVRICLTEDELKEMSEYYEVDAASVPSVIVEELQNHIDADKLDLFFLTFENVEKEFSILTDDYTSYPECA